MAQNDLSCENSLEFGQIPHFYRPWPGLIEVRDSRTGYFIPVRYGLGLLPLGELSARRCRRRRRRHLDRESVYITSVPP